jgi:hypothetical protein
VRQSHQRPVLLLYDDEPDEVLNFFIYCTRLNLSDTLPTAQSCQVIQIYGNRPNEDRVLLKMINKALSQVKGWLLLSS